MFLDIKTAAQIDADHVILYVTPVTVPTAAGGSDGSAANASSAGGSVVGGASPKIVAISVERCGMAVGAGVPSCGPDAGAEQMFALTEEGTN